MKELEKNLQYHFNNQHLLHQALTHTSKTGKLSENYERLEFLGDRVLGVAVAEMVYRVFPAEPEGSLSQRFMALVCKETVAEMALKLGLDRYIMAESVDVHHNDNVLCDVCEAVIGAMYLDGGCQTAIDFVQERWRPLVDTPGRRKMPKLCCRKPRTKRVCRRRGMWRSAAKAPNTIRFFTCRWK